MCDVRRGLRKRSQIEKKNEDGSVALRALGPISISMYIYSFIGNAGTFGALATAAGVDGYSDDYTNDYESGGGRVRTAGQESRRNGHGMIPFGTRH